MTPEQRQVDERFMRRAIGLAMRGRGYVEPNPMVGCVIVRDGVVIGEGWHEQFGGRHAEPNALEAVREGGRSTEGATAYVTLEPCCHTNKKTPPCVPELIGAGLARVVIGCEDPNPEVAGRGVKLLREAGMGVEVGILKDECRQVIAPFVARVVHRRPYVTLKWAESADGKVAGPGGQRVWISNEVSRRVVHELRTRSDAVMVGVDTVLKDDPQLSVRGVEKVREPAIVVLDTRLRTPVEAKVIRQHEQTVYVFCSDDAALRVGSDEAERLRDREAVVMPTATTAQGHVDLGRVLAELAAEGEGMSNVLVEPGPTLARSFLASDLADRVWVFRSPGTIGEGSAPDAARIPGHFIATGSIELDGDVLREYLNPRSAAFYAAEPSADFVRVAEGRR